jgi:hypothetical protein
MKVCNYCGVELDAEMNYCPLCGHKSNSPILKKQKESNEKGATVSNPENFNFEELTQQQQKKVVWELAAFIVISCTVITLIIDLLIAKHITWSKYTLTIGMTLLIDISLIIFMQKRIFLLFLGCFLSTSFLLFLLDLFSHNLDGGVKLGIPIIFFIFLVILLLFLLIRKTKQKGINIIAYSLVAAGIICLCIEGIISLHIHEYLKFQWSFIVMVAVLPVSAILLYIHYRLKRVTNLKKVFHI